MDPLLAPLQNSETQPILTAPHEEVAFLRERLQQLETQLQSQRPGVPLEEKRMEIAHNLVEAYHATPGVQVLSENHLMPTKEIEQVSLNLKPESHDTQMEELYAVMIERGIKNSLSVLDAMHNPHLEDDFHRFLVQYLVTMHEIPGLTPKHELYKPLNMTLFEIMLPRPEEEEKRTFKEFTSMMEQFYAGMQSVATGENPDRNYYTLEVALATGTDQIIFYAGIPNESRDLFNKHVLGIFPNARVTPAPDDYNIFAESNKSAMAVGMPSRHEVLSMRTYDEFESDPMDVLLNVFSKLEKHSEGAAIQFVISPVGNEYIKKYGKILEKVSIGESIDSASYKPDIFSSTVTSLFEGKKSPEDKAKEEKKKEELRVTNKPIIDSITKKLSSAIVETNIRCISSAPTQERASSILREIMSAFNQFGSSQGNSIEFDLIKQRYEESFIKDFAFRMFNRGSVLHLNMKELATMCHFPAFISEAPQLKQAQAATAPAPLDMPENGILLGYNIHRGVTKEIRLTRQDRLRHFYMIGQTGTGKSGTILNMVYQDIHNGDGLCYIDPHGNDVQTILGWIPENRLDDVIYFDPAYTARPMGLNMLEYDPSRPEQKTLIIDELMGIFNQLFDMQAHGGAMFQQYFKNAAFLVMDHPESGNTLLEITRVLGDKAFREMKLSHCKNPIVRQFWENAEKTTGDQSLANFVPYISSKFDPLISNEILRPVVIQEKSAFNMRDVMDNKKILLINLSKGRLGDLNANLVGLILVGKIQMAALSRADSYGKEFPDFYLYIDEFQNITTPSISSILSEARKYKLSLNVAHQFIGQLSDDIRKAVMGNVGNMQIFRVSSEDAKELEPRVAPVFTSADIMKLEFRNAYMSMLVNGQPVPAFNIVTPDWAPQNKEIVEYVKELSYLKFGRPRDEVEAEIIARYDKKG